MSSKKINKILMFGIAGIIVLVGGFAVSQFIKIQKAEDATVIVLDGADGPISIFLAGKLSGGEAVGYTSISMEEAKENFALEGDYIILDVRRADEFQEGHIPGAINIANEDIMELASVKLPIFDQTIYVYCRSGNRSKQASEKLVSLGYSNVIECGGIIDWTGDLEK